MTIFTRLTHLDRVATALGKRLLLVINPLVEDDDAYDVYLKAAAGSVMAVVSMIDYRHATMTSRLAAKRGWVNFRLPETSPLDEPGNSVQYSTRAERVVGTAVLKPLDSNIRNYLFDRKMS